MNKYEFIKYYENRNFPDDTVEWEFYTILSFLESYYKKEEGAHTPEKLPWPDKIIEETIESVERHHHEYSLNKNNRFANIRIFYRERLEYYLQAQKIIKNHFFDPISHFSFLSEGEKEILLNHNLTHLAHFKETEKLSFFHQEACAAVPGDDSLRMEIEGIAVKIKKKDKNIIRIYNKSKKAINLILTIRSGLKHGALDIPGRIITTSLDNIIKEWDIKTKAYQRQFQGHTMQINSVCLSPEGDKLLTASDDGTIREWNRNKSVCIIIYNGHSNKVNRAIYSPGGKTVLSVSRDRKIIEWERETGKPLLEYNDVTGSAVDIICAPEGDRFFTLSVNGEILEWQRGEKSCQKFQTAKDSLSCGLITPGGKRMLCGQADSTISLWDTKERRLERHFEGHTSVVHSLCLSPTGDRLLSSSEDKTVREWDLRTGKCLRVLASNTPLISSRYDNTGRRIEWLSSFGSWKSISLEKDLKDNVFTIPEKYSIEINCPQYGYYDYKLPFDIFTISDINDRVFLALRENC